MWPHLEGDVIGGWMIASLISELRNPASPKTRLTIGSSKIDRTKCFNSTLMAEIEMGLLLRWIWLRWYISGCLRWLAWARLIAAVRELEMGGAASSFWEEEGEEGRRSRETPTQSSRARRWRRGEYPAPELPPREMESRRREKEGESKADIA